MFWKKKKKIVRLKSMKNLPHPGRPQSTFAHKKHILLKICKNMRWPTPKDMNTEFKETSKAKLSARTLLNHYCTNKAKSNMRVWHQQARLRQSKNIRICLLVSIAMFSNKSRICIGVGHDKRKIYLKVAKWKKRW